MLHLASILILLILNCAVSLIDSPALSVLPLRFTRRDLFFYHIRCCLFIPEMCHRCPEIHSLFFFIFTLYALGWSFWYLSTRGLVLPSSVHLILFALHITFFFYSSDVSYNVRTQKTDAKSVAERRRVRLASEAVKNVTSALKGFSLLCAPFHFECFFFYGSPGFLQFYIHLAVCRTVR